MTYRHHTQAGDSKRCYQLLLSVILCIALSPALAHGQESGKPSSAPERTGPEPVVPWDFDPYRVLVWFVSDDPGVNAEQLQEEVSDALRPDFDALWRVTYQDAPASVAAIVRRDLATLDFDQLAAGDPVVAVKRNHPEAIRIRYAKDLADTVDRIHIGKRRLAAIERDPASAEGEVFQSLRPRFETFDSDQISVGDIWSSEDSEAIVLARGTTDQLVEPEPKILDLPLPDSMVRRIRDFDKVFLLRLQTRRLPLRVEARELDTLMRYFSPPAEAGAPTHQSLPTTVARVLTRAFAPTVRIDQAGTRHASCLPRAGGLITDPDSPAAIGVGDVLRPMIRKNDRKGIPLMIGPVDWAYLIVQKPDGRRWEADIYAGRTGGLKVRLNNRTFRTALKVRRPNAATELRLHAKDDPEVPLVGYELHERTLGTRNMSFVGRTDWDGRLRIAKTDQTMRLFYVKNGGAILARLPMVPGMLRNESADLTGDDVRLKAEGYVRGVQYAIIDLVGVRELFADRIRKRIKEGRIKVAEELLNQFREQPGAQQIADDLSSKQDEFLKAMSGDPNQRRKIDNLFAQTREILVKHVNSRLLTELEELVLSASKKQAAENQ